MGARQLAGWIAYAELEPFGEERADIRIAQLCSLYANVNYKGKFKVGDFMLQKQKTRRTSRPSSGQVKTWFKAVAAAFGGGGE